jgi:signal transduction histidine kinase
MSSSIAESTGIWRFGRLAFTGMGCSLAVCYGKAAIIGLLVLFGASETLEFNPHLQAVSMVLFAVFGLWGLGRDQRHIHDPWPLILGLTGVVILALTIYVYFHKTVELTAYTMMILSVFWNQNIALKRLAEQLQQRSQDVEAKNAQLAQASQMKSKFLAAMSHELRTPLNAIIGFSEVLDARMFGQLNEKQAEYVKDIHESGRHLLSLINDILDLSKIEAGRMELALSPFDLHQLLESATLLVQERAAKHGLTLEVSIDERLGSIVADQLKLKQILLNLLTNAVKFTPDGGRIQVKAVREDGAVTLSVSDTGIGIAPEDRAAIFDEFRQVITEDGRKREGTGLGLALTERFVDMHHGTIGVQSEPGKGATFTVTLPLTPS